MRSNECVKKGAYGRIGATILGGGLVDEIMSVTGRGDYFYIRRNEVIGGGLGHIFFLKSGH